MATVRLITAAYEDLLLLKKRDPQIVRQVLVKIELIARHAEAGVQLAGELSNFRKLKVGNREYRIIWRVLHEQSGELIYEIGEIWAIGPRDKNKVYQEVRKRIESLPDSKDSLELKDVIELLFGRTNRSRAVVEDPVPDYLAELLRNEVGLYELQIRKLTGFEALEIWSEFLRKR